MPTYCCTFQLPSGDRELKRKALISYFLDELAGTATETMPHVMSTQSKPMEITAST